MFENLTEKLERSFKILKGEGKITEINIADALKDIRRALLMPMSVTGSQSSSAMMSRKRQ